MQDIQKMTDAELVEAVAREVLNITNYKVFDRIIQPIVKWENIDTYPEAWRPFSDMNDLFMVLEKVERWEIHRYRDGYRVAMVKTIGPNEESWIGNFNCDLPRAVLEAALSAERGK